MDTADTIPYDTIPDWQGSSLRFLSSRHNAWRSHTHSLVTTSPPGHLYSTTFGFMAEQQDDLAGSLDYIFLQACPPSVTCLFDGFLRGLAVNWRLTGLWSESAPLLAVADKLSPQSSSSLVCFCSRQVVFGDLVSFRQIVSWRKRKKTTTQIF